MTAGRERPPFEPGNKVSLVHGAESERTIEAKARDMHTEIVAVAPWLDEPHFAAAVVRYLRAAARERLLDEHIQRVCDEKGTAAVPTRVWEQVTAAARLAARLGQDLGLDPIGHARLKAVAASAEISTATLAELSAAGRQSRIAAEARLADVDASADEAVGS